MRRAAAEGTSYGAPTKREVLLAEAIRQRVPSCQKVRLVNSGTEATMSAVRLARGATGRDRSDLKAGVQLACSSVRECTLNKRLSNPG